MVTTIVLNTTPPSFNKVGYTGNRWALTRAKKQLQQTVEGMLMASGMPRNLDSVRASASMRFPKRRGRDANNYEVILDKALGDALKNGRWIADDQPEFYSFAGVTFEPDVGPERTTVVLEYELKGDPPAPIAA